MLVEKVKKENKSMRVIFYKFVIIIAIYFTCLSSTAAGTRPYNSSEQSRSHYLETSGFLGVVVKVGGPITFPEFKSLMSHRSDLVHVELKRLWKNHLVSLKESFIVLKSFTPDISAGDVLFAEYDSSSSNYFDNGDVFFVVFFNSNRDGRPIKLGYDDCGTITKNYSKLLTSSIQSKSDVIEFIVENKMLQCAHD
ncbi:hypothetical protein [Brumicola blandensis]|uniref:Uncharacterized protein n=1 Tax=Brumicola blandensis TaxID=3075611 RepID=A0AAW8QVN1_9ALTE|nr:hypothetical protein [Alteromonas sp. W409]MDT0581097.1 hypothetical protein [Alteromonas sp. W409]